MVYLLSKTLPWIRIHEPKLNMKYKAVKKLKETMDLNQICVGESSKESSINKSIGIFYNLLRYAY